MNKRKQVTDRIQEKSPEIGDFLKKIIEVTEDDYVKTLASLALQKVNGQELFKEAIYKMASKRLNNIEDYIMMAKQTIDNMERMNV